MPVRTENGWKSRHELAKAEEHYLKAHAALLEKLGPAGDDPELLKAKADELFKKIDVDNSGGICNKELQQALSECGVVLSLKEVNSIIASFDENGDGLVDMAEFQALLQLEVDNYKRHTKTICAIS